ncbi:hypothetical protein GCM10007320_63700 [Pseudorhodoferax aquiterrae]|uniref:Uncharacterized protein n=1 Tax=Pseudorhodoferax aquiterrae TaxID=747304 RepID=A0ABQ3GH71_9BURK|nr:hypothetical protein [Pseudorhodoferax aquiterrae]GHD03517.1 hypothetical protein GCM10007320_63700 [Pseudorhodoferax aquiterrae]
MDKAETQRLSEMQAHEPTATCKALRDSGFADLAEDWIASRNEFEAQRKQSPVEVPGTLLQAYARMRMCWFKIGQLKEAALRRLDHRDHH